MTLNILSAYVETYRRGKFVSVYTKNCAPSNQAIDIMAEMKRYAPKFPFFIKTPLADNAKFLKFIRDYTILPIILTNIFGRILNQFRVISHLSNYLLVCKQKLC